mmetsp:Transcript_13960/g.35936  ORF Transcript_13960/g.35936 Transcript_13960/m.35936 type:complete len:232 (+) Transcript_13960:907-1602(+)
MARERPRRPRGWCRVPTASTAGRTTWCSTETTGGCETATGIAFGATTAPAGSTCLATCATRRRQRWSSMEGRRCTPTATSLCKEGGRSALRRRGSVVDRGTRTLTLTPCGSASAATTNAGYCGSGTTYRTRQAGACAKISLMGAAPRLCGATTTRLSSTLPGPPAQPPTSRATSVGWTSRSGSSGLTPTHTPASSTAAHNIRPRRYLPTHVASYGRVLVRTDAPVPTHLAP